MLDIKDQFEPNFTHERCSILKISNKAHPGKVKQCMDNVGCSITFWTSAIERQKIRVAAFLKY